MRERTIKSIGFVTKKELVKSVEFDTRSKIMMLESDKPFPGYYIRHSNPFEKQVYSIFVITKLLYNDERIIRAIQAVKKDSNFTFDGAPGSIIYQNKSYNLIRFKDLPYSGVDEVLSQFIQNGIEFRKAIKIRSSETLIKVRKFFSMKEKMDNVFQDENEEYLSYIVLPSNIRWSTFEKITMEIKYNIDDKNFDAAQTSVYAQEGLIDFVRIYDRNSCHGKLLHIKEKYEEAIAKI